MKWMDKGIKHKDFSKCFLCICDFMVLSGWRFLFGCLERKMCCCRWRPSLFAAYIKIFSSCWWNRLIEPHGLILRYLCTEPASGARSMETPPNRTSCSQLRLDAHPNSAFRKAKLWSETTPIILWPLCLSLPPPESGWVDWPPVCLSALTSAPQARPHRGALAPGRSCALKPELKSCVVIPAGETALALSGALSQRASGVTGGPLTFITPLCFCTAPTRTALFIDPCSSSKAWPCNKYQRTEVLMRSFYQLHLARAVNLHKMLVLLSGFLDECFKWLVLSVIVLCQWKYNDTVICYVYVGQSHFYTLVCKVTRKSGFRKNATFECLWRECVIMSVFL